MLTEPELGSLLLLHTVLPFPPPPLLSVPYFHMVPSSTPLSKVAILEFSLLQLTTLFSFHLSLGGEGLIPFLVLYEGHEAVGDMFVTQSSGLNFYDRIFLLSWQGG